jgi:hypothetical protein
MEGFDIALGLGTLLPDALLGFKASPFNMCFEFAKLLPHVKIP